MNFKNKDERLIGFEICLPQSDVKEEAHIDCGPFMSGQ